MLAISLDDRMREIGLQSSIGLYIAYKLVAVPIRDLIKYLNNEHAYIIGGGLVNTQQAVDINS